VVKTGKSWPGMVAVLESELERKLEAVLKFRSTCEGGSES
jgi:hypothetical protein